MSNVHVLTGIPNIPFEVLRPVMGLGGDGISAGEAAGRQLAQRMLGFSTGGSTCSPQEAFDRAVATLEQAGAALGADAVVGVQFVPRVAMANGFQAYEIAAFGTAVRYVRERNADAVHRVSRLNAGEVLVKAGLPQYIKAFADAGFVADRVPSLSDLDLRAIGIGDAAHRQVILQTIAAAAVGK
jgi:uncharacterized protein YbjQ (UPF0145 family)